MWSSRPIWLSPLMCQLCRVFKAYIVDIHGLTALCGRPGPYGCHLSSFVWELCRVSQTHIVDTHRGSALCGLQDACSCHLMSGLCGLQGPYTWRQAWGVASAAHDSMRGCCSPPFLKNTPYVRRERKGVRLEGVRRNGIPCSDADEVKSGDSSGGSSPAKSYAVPMRPRPEPRVIGTCYYTSIRDLNFEREGRICSTPGSSKLCSSTGYWGGSNTCVPAKMYCRRQLWIVTALTLLLVCTVLAEAEPKVTQREIGALSTQEIEEDLQVRNVDISHGSASC